MPTREKANSAQAKVLRAASIVIAITLVIVLSYGMCLGGDEPRALQAKIVSISGYEDYWIETDMGQFESPCHSTIVDTESNGYEQLRDALEGLVGKTVLLHLDHDIVVGVSEPQSGLKVTPPYRLKQKMKYKGVETKRETTLGYWTEDEFLLVIHTPEGWYCVDSNYEYVDYYDKVVAKLRAQVAREARAYRPISLSVYNLSSVNDCLGYVADIEFLPVKAGGK